MIGKTKASYGSSPDAAVENFLNQHRSLFQIEENDFELTQVRTLSSKSGTHKFKYQQMYKNTPVLHSGYLVSVTEDGFIDYISGDFYDDISIDVTPELSAEQALGVITADLGTDKYTIHKEAALSI